MLLGNIGINVLPNQLAVSGVNKLVNDNNVVSDEKTIKNLHNIGRSLAEAVLQSKK
jgi:hypothetical protein